MHSQGKMAGNGEKWHALSTQCQAQCWAVGTCFFAETSKCSSSLGVIVSSVLWLLSLSRMLFARGGASYPVSTSKGQAEIQTQARLCTPCSITPPQQIRCLSLKSSWFSARETEPGLQVPVKEALTASAAPTRCQENTTALKEGSSGELTKWNTKNQGLRGKDGIPKQSLNLG